MRAWRNVRKGQRGFTLVEMMITAAVAGMLMVVVSRIFLGGFTGWLFNYSALVAQQKSRIFRDALIRNLRQAQASTIEISRYNNQVPPRSMISFTDASGKNWAFLQHQNTAVISTWGVDGLTGERRVGKWNGSTWQLNDAVIPSKVERIIFYTPNIKDLRNIQFAINLEWSLLTDNKRKPVTIQMVGDVEIRDP